MSLRRVCVVLFLFFLYFLIYSNPDKRRSEVLHILILSSWSSGSTFLSKLVSHYPGVFLMFEPLVMISSEGAVEAGQVNDSRQLLKDLFRCNYEADSWGSKLLGFLKTDLYKDWILHNDLLRAGCEENPSLCYSPDLVSASCQSHPIRLIKTVRVRLNQIQQFLTDTELRLKIIVLLRDPRAVRSSRNKRIWCNFSACNSVIKLCQQYEEDLTSARHLAISHPDQVLIAKYEEIVTLPHITLPIILKFLNLSWNSEIERFISEHMMGGGGSGESDFHAESKVSRALADKWRGTLRESELEKLRRSCNTSIDHHQQLSMRDSQFIYNLTSK